MKTVYAFLLIFLMSAAAAQATAPTSKTVYLNDSTITKLADGTNSLKHIYIYNQYGKKTIDEVMTWDGTAWVYNEVKTTTSPISTRQELTYNSLNQNIQTLKSNRSGGQWIPSTKSVSVFANGLEIISEDSIIDSNNTAKYRANFHTENIYDIKGNKTSTRDKWNNVANATTGVQANTWSKPYDHSVVFSDSINGTDTLGIAHKYLRTLSVTTSLYDLPSTSFINTSKNEMVYDSKAFKIGSVNSLYASSVWTPNFKLEILGDSTASTSRINKYTYTSGAYVLTSTDYRYFTPRTVNILASVNNTYAIELTLSPNPVKDQLKVSGLEESAKITILDLTGKAVITRTIANNESISLGALTPGIYIAKVTNLQGELVYRTKLIKQ